MTYLCPPDSSVSDAFQMLPSLTLTSRPSVISCPSGGCSFAKFPGNSSPNIRPKSLFDQSLHSVTREQTHPLTFSQVLTSFPLLCRSSSTIVSWIIDLSLTTVAIIFFKACSFFSTLSISLVQPPWERDSLVDHIHDLGIDLLAHTLLLRFKLSALITGVTEINTIEVVR